jgi:EAL domain-containing protein (putative c-di-GMP-specific phosphodiesterase class I)
MKNVDPANTPLPPEISYSKSTEEQLKRTFDSDFAVDAACNSCDFQPGELIFSEGSPADKAYIVESGLVEIFVGSDAETVQLNTLGPGDIFGEVGLIDAFPRSASAKALSECRCIVVSAIQIAERIESSPPMVKMLMSMALHRNRTYNSYLKTHVHPSSDHFIDPISIQNTYVHSYQYKKILEDIKLESELKSAIQNHELALYYQPLYSLSQKNLIGFEALLRWQSQTRGMLSPGQFIPIAEETSLIVPMGLWIIQQACLDLKHFQAGMDPGQETNPTLFISVNISVRQFLEPEFLDRLLAMVAHHGIPPGQLKLEVTERIFLEQAEAIDTISKCREAGFEIALDDFGTGYSSLNYLERCEIDTLKIDQSFTQKICTSERAKILVGSIIDIGKKLGLPTVAEGIETADQMVVLRDMGCDIGQGFLFSRPVSFPKALTLLNQPAR